MALNKKSKIIISVVGIVVLVGILVGAYFAFVPKAEKGSKTIYVQVVYQDKHEDNYTIKTDEAYLLNMMQKQKKFSFAGKESTYGYMLTTINNVVADSNEAAVYWAIYINNEYANVGIAEQPITNNDHVKFEYSSY